MFRYYRINKKDTFRFNQRFPIRKFDFSFYDIFLNQTNIHSKFFGIFHVSFTDFENGSIWMNLAKNFLKIVEETDGGLLDGSAISVARDNFNQNCIDWCKKKGWYVKENANF